MQPRAVINDILVYGMQYVFNFVIPKADESN